MKTLCLLLPIAIFGLVLNSCQPIERGGNNGNGPAAGGGLRAGQFARTLINDTAFFRQLPLSGGQADLLLQRHTSLRLIQVDETYSKVELDSGEIGFVLTAMLEPMPKPDQPQQPKQPDRFDPDRLKPRPDPQPGPGDPELPLLPPTIEPE